MKRFSIRAGNLNMSGTPAIGDVPIFDAPARPGRLRALAMKGVGKFGSAIGWVFGLISLVVGLSVLAALPILQFLSLGYLLESSARVARSGRLRDGLIGVRKAARVGGAAVGTLVSLVPLWLVGSQARAAALLDPGGSIARGWRFAALVVWALTCLHLLTAFARDGRLRRFVWPLGNPLWLYRELRLGGLYSTARDGFWEFAAGLRPPYYFKLGLVGFLGTLVWLLPPSAMLGVSPRFPLLGFLGAILLAVVVPWLPFLQVEYAIQGRAGALFSPRAVRGRFKRAPWAFAFALAVLLLASIPLYLLKIEMVPREAVWLPSLVFVVFLAPARLLVGWAHARSGRRDRARHWVFRLLGRLAIVAVALLYVLVVFFSQYTSWGGAGSLHEQHAFLLPAPFWGE